LFESHVRSPHMRSQFALVALTALAARVSSLGRQIPLDVNIALTVRKMTSSPPKKLERARTPLHWQLVRMLAQIVLFLGRDPGIYSPRSDAE
jgi:hypothetical protein